MDPETLSVEVPGGRLAVERRPGPGPTLVLLHSGVNDRRAWAATAERLGDAYAVVAYDRRGFGESPIGTDLSFTHLADLVAVLDAVGADRVWLLAGSAGGRVALDAALTVPERVAGLVLLAPAVNGAPTPEDVDPVTEELDGAIDAAIAAGDLAEANRLEARLWLDGPAGPEGRVSGPARDLFLAMNAIVLRTETTTPAGSGDTGIDAWSRLAEVTVPVTVAWGDLDVAVLNRRCAELVDRLPSATGIELPGVAHLPNLEDPDLVAGLVRRAVGTGG